MKVKIIKTKIFSPVEVSIIFDSLGEMERVYVDLTREEAHYISKDIGNIILKEINNVKD